MSNGKGDTTRPPSVPRDTFAANWDRTFRDVTQRIADKTRVDTEVQVYGETRQGRILRGDGWECHYSEQAPFPDSPDAEA